MNKSDITIVVVSYYRSNRLKRCLDSLNDMSNIIVWDNNTTGEELIKIKEIVPNYTNVDFIFSEQNLGLTTAWNRGIIKSNTDWVLLTCDDMIFDDDWFDVLNNILEERPHLEQIHLNAWNAMVIHKKTIVRMGWWDERYRFYPSMEDDDWYLRTVEELGYSPYGTYAEHIPFSSNYIEKIQPYIDSKKELFDRNDNFTYYCNSIHSNNKIIGKSTITGQEDDAGSRNNSGGSIDRGDNITGVEFHHHKWEFISDPNRLYEEGVLLGKDGRMWKRLTDEPDFYPDVRSEYAMKYFGMKL